MKVQAATALGPLIAKYNEAVQATLDADKSLIGFAATLRMVNTVMDTNSKAFYQYQKDAVSAINAIDTEPIASLTGAMYAQRDAAQEAAPPTYDSALAMEQYNAAIAGADAAAINAIATSTQNAADAASNMAIAGMEAAAALGEMSMASFIAQQIDILTAAEQEGKISKQELEAATRELLVQSGLLTEAEALAAWQAGITREAFYAEKISADALAGSLVGIKDGINNIPPYKKAIIEIVTKHIDAFGGLENYEQHQEGLGNNANGTDNWRGGMTWVGERGPELVNLPRGTQIHDAQSSQNITNNSWDVSINTAATSGTWEQNIAYAQAMAQ